MKTNIVGWIALYTGKHADPKKPQFYWYACKSFTSDANFTAVVQHTIEAEIPDDFDPRPVQIAAIDADIAKARADFTAMVTELQERKSRLLAIEMVNA
jgi:hypothetical protein